MASSPEVRTSMGGLAGQREGTPSSARRRGATSIRAPLLPLRALVGQLARARGRPNLPPLRRRLAAWCCLPPAPCCLHAHPAHAFTRPARNPRAHSPSTPPPLPSLSTESDGHQGQAPHRGQPRPRHGRGRLRGFPPVHLPGGAGRPCACVPERWRRMGRGRGGAATQRARGAHGRCDPLSSLHPPPLSTPSPHAPLSLSHHAAPQVICVDNFFTGSKENIAHLIDKVRREREKERGRGVSALSLGDHLHLSLSSLPHALPPPVPFPPSPTSRSSATTSSRRSSSKSTRSTTWPAPPRPSTTSTTPLRPSKPLSWAP